MLVKDIVKLIKNQDYTISFPFYELCNFFTEKSKYSYYNEIAIAVMNDDVEDVQDMVDLYKSNGKIIKVENKLFESIDMFNKYKRKVYIYFDDVKDEIDVDELELKNYLLNLDCDEILYNDTKKALILTII